VKDYLGEIPREFSDSPKAALLRFITSPNLEFQLAVDMSNILDLDFIFMEFLQDKFCTRNQDKFYLGKMVFFHEKNGDGLCITEKKKVIDLEKSDNKSFEEIKTVWGEDFINFHKRITKSAYGKIKTFDVSKFKNNGDDAFNSYLRIFSLFICNGILLENYFIDSNKDENRFTCDVIKPAFDKVKEIFGVRPLIVPLINRGEDGYKFWQYYPDTLQKEVTQKK
jgi:hypothetical protein